MKRRKCPQCDRKLVPFEGPKDADILFIGEFPGYYEVESGFPFNGPTGEVLRYELKMQTDIDYKECRAGNLWQHGKVKSCSLRWHREQADEEISKRRYVLMMGSDFGGLYYPGNVMENNGRKIIFPGGAEGIITTSPASIPQDSAGEFRFALERFERLINGEGGLGQPAAYREMEEPEDG